MVIPLEGVGKTAAGEGSRTHCRHSDLLGLEHGPGTTTVLSASFDSDEQAGLRTSAQKSPLLILYHPALIILLAPATVASEVPGKALFFLPGILSP